VTLKQRCFFLNVIVVLCVLQAACSTESNYAPVTDINTIEAIPQAGVYHVKSNETLYAIAWRYGLDYRMLAVRNHIQPPYIVFPGQSIYLRATKPTSMPYPQVVTAPHRAAVASTMQTKVTIERKPIATVNKTMPERQGSVVAITSSNEPHFRVTKWIWPVKGKIIQTYSSTNKGINIAGYLDEPIYASAAGKIVYCGDGLRGYGNLIILKHNSTYLSAYAYNRRIYVKEGEWVKQGQKIADMGDTGTNKVMLHFEIRRAGRPIDPRSVLFAEP
jgi:lipoprotein NlpD